MANSLGYVLEHRLVWAQANNMASVPEGMVIHHINGNKKDNRTENLLALPLRNHSPSLTVKEVQKKLRQVEATVRALKSQMRLY